MSEEEQRFYGGGEVLVLGATEPEKKVSGVEKGVLNTSKVLNYISWAMLFVLMVLGSVDVIGRYLLNKPLKGTMETSELLLAGIVFFSWAATQAAKEHTSVDLVFNHFPKRVKLILNFITSCMAVVLFGLIAWQGALVARQLYQAGRLVYTVEIPLAPFQLFVPIGATAMCLVLIVQTIQAFQQMRRRG